MNEPRRERFTRVLRLRHRKEFDAVYAGRARVERGPLIVHGIPNALGHSRLGLAIARRVGSAPRRNRLKRKIREVFRTARATWPGDYDLVVSSKPHADVPIAAYRELLHSALERLHDTWTKRRQRNDRPTPSGPPSPPAL